MVIGDDKTEGVVAVMRALTILDAFNAGEPALSLSEMARRTRLPKTTVLRIARSMVLSQYLVQLADGSWRLGAACGWAGYRYNMAYDAVIIEPVLRDVSRQTGETASFLVREGRSRVCIARVDGPRSPREHVRIGEIRPLGTGAGGAVLRAFSGEPGELYDRIRHAGYHSTLANRSDSTGSVAYPVLGINHALIGCVSVFGLIEHFNQRSAERCARIVRKAAARLTFELASSHGKRNEMARRKWREVEGSRESPVDDTPGKPNRP